MSNRIIGPPSGMESLHSAVENEFARGRTHSGAATGSEPAAAAKTSASGANLARGNGKDPGLAKAAEEFESLLLAQMLRTVRETGGGGWMGSGKGLGGDSTMELAETQLAKAMAQTGALGLSKMLTRDAARKSPHHGATASKGAGSKDPAPEAGSPKR